MEIRFFISRVVKLLLTFFILSFMDSERITAAKRPVNVIGYDTSSYEKDLIKSTYSQDFEGKDRSLNAWASYPLWQDNAYDPNIRIGRILPGEENLSLVQKVTPYSNVDNFAGAQKLLDMYLVPNSQVKIRYYLKTNNHPTFFKIRFAAGPYGKLDVTIPNPEINKWTQVTLNFEDFAAENPVIAGKSKVKIYALAFLTEISDADPAMPFYLGLDDIIFSGGVVAPFKFTSPHVYKLPEFGQYIPTRGYHKGDVFELQGTWTPDVANVKLKITSYMDSSKIFYSGDLSANGVGSWKINPISLSFPDGLYIGRLSALNDKNNEISFTEFTLHISPKDIFGKHPRLLFDSAREEVIRRRFMDSRFAEINKNVKINADAERKKIPISSLIFDLDQFPDEDWLPSWDAFGAHIYATGDALKWNALSYTFHHDVVAGEYVKDVLLKLSEWPIWASPRDIKRGRFSDHRMGTWSHNVALAYDLIYGLMTPSERTIVRNAIFKNIVQGAYKTYVYYDAVTSNTSNWVGHITGGALMNLAAIFEDDTDMNLEPYLTGNMMKFYNFISAVTDKKDGAWGEGYGYNNYTFSNFTFSIPAIKNVFNVDFSSPLAGTFKEYIWAGIIKSKKWFGYGDSNDSIMPATNWKFLLSMRPDSTLNWFYNYLKDGETLNDVLFDEPAIKQADPFEEKPVKVFHRIGTTVFKSGWGKDDLVFVMRTGAFFNHQHLDQGSFWFADRGTTFIADQPIRNSDYYEDPLYQSDFIQPVSHSSILLNNNHQSQRVGDPDSRYFAPGFDDHAFIANFLDGKDAAFSRGDLSGLYWGKVKSLTRNVLYLKPRTILMIDIAIPGSKDVDVNLLYHTQRLEDIYPNQRTSRITKDGNSLNIVHLSPKIVESKAVETPHYLNTLRREKPLIKEGMLEVSSRTKGVPLVIANLLITTPGGNSPDVSHEMHDGFVSGIASGKRFLFSTRPGDRYKFSDVETDALTMTWDDSWYFAAMATILKKDGVPILKSSLPLTFEYRNNELKYSTDGNPTIAINSKTKPKSITINGSKTKIFTYDKKLNEVHIQIPAGEGNVILH